MGSSHQNVKQILNKLHHRQDLQRDMRSGLFYCQGGICYEKMSKPSKLAMKAFVSVLGKKKDLTESEKAMVEMISHSYDISDPKYIEPLATYLRGENGQDNESFVRPMSE